MTDRSDPERPEIFCCQFRQDILIDVIVAERLLVPLKPEVSQPSLNIHLPLPVRGGSLVGSIIHQKPVFDFRPAAGDVVGGPSFRTPTSTP